MFGLTQKINTDLEPTPLPMTAAAPDPDTFPAYPELDTLSEANDYRRALTRQIVDAAKQRDLPRLTSLHARYGVLSLLIVGLVFQEAQALLRDWQELTQANEHSLGVARQSVTDCQTAYDAVRERASDDTNAKYDRLRMAHVQLGQLADKAPALEAGRMAAGQLVHEADSALWLCVHDANAALKQADVILHQLSEQQALCRRQRTPEPARPFIFSVIS